MLFSPTHLHLCECVSVFSFISNDLMILFFLPSFLQHQLKGVIGS